MTLHDYFPRPFHFHPKNWSIRTKIVFIGIITTIFSMASTLLALGVVLGQYSQVRKDLSVDYQRRVQRGIEVVTELRKIFAHDYAYWTEMYDAVEAGDTEWIAKATSGSITTYKADGNWIFTKDGVLLHSDIKTTVPFPLTFDEAILSNLSRTEAADFYRVIDGVPVHYLVSPIIDPQHSELPSSGFMIVAKIWDQNRLDEIGSIVGAKVDLTEKKESIFLTDDNIFITHTFFNEMNKEEFRASFAFEDRSLQLVRNSLLFMLLISAILGGGLIYFSLRQQSHWFVGPIRKLIEELRTELGSKEGTIASLTSNDELEILKEVVSDHIEKLRQNKRLSLAVESSTNGIVVTDLSGTIQYVNKSWTTINGYASEESIGKNPSMLQSKKTSRDEYIQMWKSLSAGHAFTSESVINVRKDGTEYDCRLSVYPIEEKGSVVGYVGIQQNISHRKEVDRMKTEFISMASHQLRTPLSAMRWFGELLLENKGGELLPKQRELVQNFYDSTLRMISLVSALLNISRLESGRMIVEPVPTQIASLIESVFTELSARIDAKKLKVTKNIAQDLPIISVDPQLVREVYSNLLTNAVKYTPEGGEITLSIDQTTTDIKSTITDTGVGIPEADRTKVFTKFFRSKNVTSFETDGTGLGLYLVQSIIESSEGAIGFDSVEGKGTTFWFTLPKKGMEQKNGSVRIGK